MTEMVFLQNFWIFDITLVMTFDEKILAKVLLSKCLLTGKTKVLFDYFIKISNLFMYVQNFD